MSVFDSLSTFVFCVRFVLPAKETFSNGLWILYLPSNDGGVKTEKTIVLLFVIISTTVTGHPIRYYNVNRDYHSKSFLMKYHGMAFESMVA
ncbi:hypothetical protein [Nitrosomonas marina]|uniref:hypothetical protein n=1 Tax=Nitrosomonas marina TaxID=917 RepID=UPI00115FFAB2|nr:hypothetical protein [Nitrosomonas marina]